MANEITIRVGLTIRKDNLQYQNQPQAFLADMDTGKGPTPGALTVPTGGEIVNLGELTNPGWCVISNCDSDNFISWGIYDPDIDRYYPVGELLPGESCIVRLWRFFGQEYDGTGTGTTAPSSKLFLKADTAACVVKVEAFEK